MAIFNVGDTVQLNDKYIDKRDRLGEKLTIVEIAEVCGKECVWTDPPLGGGGYAADGFDLVEGDA